MDVTQGKKMYASNTTAMINLEDQILLTTELASGQANVLNLGLQIDAQKFNHSFLLILFTSFDFHVGFPVQRNKSKFSFNQLICTQPSLFSLLVM